MLKFKRVVRELIEKENIISQNYIDKQTEYLNSLTNEEKYVIYLYTRGFSYIMNTFIRNNFTAYEDMSSGALRTLSAFCKDTESKVQDCLMYYYQKLQNIILTAPKTEEEIVVYRGIYKIDFFKTREVVHKNLGFYQHL